MQRIISTNLLSSLFGQRLCDQLLSFALLGGLAFTDRKRESQGGVKKVQQYSVLMPVYYKENADHFRTAMESMFRQTVGPEQFVLVCDGALTEDLDQVIGEYQQRYGEMFHVIRLAENKGLGIALQEGLLHCRNELVARMDADDISLPDRMEKQLRVMEENPELAVVGGQIEEFAGDIHNSIGYRTVPVTHEKICKLAGFRNPVNHMTVLMRRSRVLQAGGYQRFHRYEDYNLWVRMLVRGHVFRNVPDLCCYARVNETFYHRRGGWRYFVGACRMELFILAKKMITPLQFAENVAIRFAGTVLLPQGIRGVLFRKIMRRNTLEQG